MPPPKQKQASFDNDDDDILQAVVLADSFNSRFKPLTTLSPRCLLPICNAPLLEWTFEALVLAGVQEIFVVCRNHADLVKAAISKSKYNSPSSGIRIIPIVTAKETFAPGDALRDVYTHGLIKSTFVLVSGDLISSLKIDKVVKLHKERQKSNKDMIMTIVVKESGGDHPTRPKGDTGLFVLDPSTSECLHYEPVPAHPYKTHVSIPREILQKHPEVEIRNDLIDCFIDICSVEVPSLFQDNFDYLDMRRDFVHGILTSDLLDRNIFCHIVKDEYAVRVKDTKSYSAVSKDILSRWTFPLVPDGNYPGEGCYQHQWGNKYFASNHPPTLSPTCKIGRNTLIGPSARIGDRVQIGSSTVGRDVTIGANTTINGSHIFHNCQVGSNCRIEQSIIGEGVRILDGTVLKRGCLLGDGVTVGPNVTLDEFSRVATVAFDYEGDSEDESEPTSSPNAPDTTARETLGAESSGYLWPPQTLDDDEADEMESFTNQRFLRLGDDGADLVQSDSGSESEESEADSDDENGASPSSSATSLPLITETSQDTEFLSECEQSLQRAFVEGHSVDNAAVELKTLRMASNVPLRRVREVVIGFLIDKVPLDTSSASQAVEVNKLVKRWGELVTAIGGVDGIEALSILQTRCAAKTSLLPVFSHMLTAFYNHDIVEEEDIRAWHASPSALGISASAKANMEYCRQIGAKLIQKLDEQSSEEESD